MMGQRLAKHQTEPDLIMSSPAKRAIKTAKIIANEIGFPISEIVTDEDIYEADVSDFIAILRQVDNSYDNVMLFGHNPGLTSLGYYLTNQQVDTLPTCGVFCVDFDIDSWRKISQGIGTLVLFDYPKNPDA